MCYLFMAQHLSIVQRSRRSSHSHIINSQVGNRAGTCSWLKDLCIQDRDWLVSMCFAMFWVSRRRSTCFLSLSSIPSCPTSPHSIVATPKNWFLAWWTENSAGSFYALFVLTRCELTHSFRLTPFWGQNMSTTDWLVFSFIVITCEDNFDARCFAGFHR